MSETKSRTLWAMGILAILIVGAGVVAIYLTRGADEESAASTAASGTESPKQEAKQLWTCSMHPQVLQDHPGSCPICGMDLEPVAGSTGAAHEHGGITIDPTVVQNMGVRTATVTEGPLKRRVRATALLKEAEPNVHEVSLRVSGWVEKLYADTEGMRLRKGDALLDLYSPELQVAIEELIAAARSGQGQTKDLMLNAAKRKLLLWGLGEAQIDELATLEAAPRTVTFRSPIAGDVTDKMIVAGSAVQAGDRVMRIVDRSKLWLDAQVFPQDISLVRLDQPVHAMVEAMPNDHFNGKVIFVSPAVDPTTRTTAVRIELSNEKLTLRPGMFATAYLQAQQIADNALLVPREAIIDTGQRQIAFVALGDGHFEPRELTLGHTGEDGLVQVTNGLSKGERVVTSGQFLLDSESRTREALAKYRAQNIEAPAPGHRH